MVEMYWPLAGGEVPKSPSCEEQWSRAVTRCTASQGDLSRSTKEKCLVKRPSKSTNNKEKAEVPERNIHWKYQVPKYWLFSMKYQN